MKSDNTPLATIFCILCIPLIGIAGSAFIFMIAPSPITVQNRQWWGLIFVALVHAFGQWGLSHYLAIFNLPHWPQIIAWAHTNPGYWRFIVIARWWWLIAAIISISITFWWVWRNPSPRDKHRRGIRLESDLNAYRRLIRELRNEKD